MNLVTEVEKTVDWASELGDAWVGTMVGQILDNERDNLLRLVRSGDLELASVAVLNLVNVCEYAQKQLNEMETISV